MGKQRVASEISEMSLNATWWGFAGGCGSGFVFVCGCGGETGLLFFRRLAGRVAGFSLLFLSDSDDEASDVSASDSDSYSDSESGCAAARRFWEGPLPRGRGFGRLEDAELGVVMEVVVVVFGEVFAGTAYCKLTADLNGLG